MSKRGWYKYAPCGAVALVVALVVGALAAFLYYQHDNAYERAKAAKSDVSSSQKNLTFTCKLTFSPEIVCSAQQPDTDAPNEHAKADLKAQQDNAQWAFGVMLVSILSLIVTTAGTVYVALTLKQNRIASRAAVKAALAAKASVTYAREASDEESRRFAEQLSLTQDTLKALQKSADFNAESAKLAREEFVATHRPKLRFNTCEFDTFGGNVPLTFKFTFINVGETNAQVFQHLMYMFIIQDGIQTGFGPVTVQDNPEWHPPGTQASLEWDSGFSLSHSQFKAVDSGEAELFFDITTHFRDENQTIRFTSALRKYHRVRRKFLKVPADHEYADQDFEG